MRNPNNSIGNQTHDLPACRAVPQPTAPPCVPVQKHTNVLKTDYSLYDLIALYFKTVLFWPVSQLC